MIVEFTGRYSICKHFSQIGVAFKRSPKCPPRVWAPAFPPLPGADWRRAIWGCCGVAAARASGLARGGHGSRLLWKPAPSLPAALRQPCAALGAPHTPRLFPRASAAPMPPAFLPLPGLLRRQWAHPALALPQCHQACPGPALA